MKYNHRHLADGEVYFVFNEGDAPYAGAATLLGRGRVEEWDAMTGRVRSIAGSVAAGGTVRVSLDIPARSTRILVIRP